MSLRVKYWLSLFIIIALALCVSAVWSVVAGPDLCVTVSDSLGFAPVLSGEKRGTFTLPGPVCLYTRLYMSSVCVKWTSTPCENLCVCRTQGNDSVCVCKGEEKK